MQMQEIMQFVTAHPVLSVAWIVLFVAVVVMTIKSRFSKVKDISRGQATQLINKETPSSSIPGRVTSTARGTSPTP